MFNLEDILDKNTAKQLSPITLEFIGDAVHSLFVREKLVFLKDDKGVNLNKKTSEEVCAISQSKIASDILPLLSQEEVEIYRRARNTKKGTRAKNATVSDYNKATGFEAVIGYLYLIGNKDRINYLLNYKKETSNEN